MKIQHMSTESVKLNHTERTGNGCSKKYNSLIEDFIEKEAELLKEEIKLRKQKYNELMEEINDVVERSRQL